MQVEFTLSFYAPGVKRESRIKKKIENSQLHLKNTVLEIDDIMIYKEFRMVCDWTDTNCNQVNEDIWKSKNSPISCTFQIKVKVYYQIKPKILPDIS